MLWNPGLNPLRQKQRDRMTEGDGECADDGVTLKQLSSSGWKPVRSSCHHLTSTLCAQLPVDGGGQCYPGSSCQHVDMCHWGEHVQTIGWVVWAPSVIPGPGTNFMHKFGDFDTVRGWQIALLSQLMRRDAMRQTMSVFFWCKWMTHFAGHSEQSGTICANIEWMPNGRKSLWHTLACHCLCQIIRDSQIWRFKFWIHDQFRSWFEPLNWRSDSWGALTI